MHRYHEIVDHLEATSQRAPTLFYGNTYHGGTHAALRHVAVGKPKVVLDDLQRLLEQAIEAQKKADAIHAEFAAVDEGRAKLREPLPDAEQRGVREMVERSNAIAAREQLPATRAQLDTLIGLQRELLEEVRKRR